MSKLYLSLVVAVGIMAGSLFGNAYYSAPSEAVVEEITLNAGEVLPISKNDPVALTPVKLSRIEADYDQVLFLDTAVNKDTVDILLTGLEEIRASGYKTAYLLLDSPGGSVIDGSRLIDYMKTSKLKVVTVCVGICASMAAQIHAQGYRRLMQPKATLMFHQASGGLSGTLEQMASQIDWIKTYIDRMDAEVVARTKMNYVEFKLRVGNELWLETIDALTLGFADGMGYVNNGATTADQSISFRAKSLGISVPNTPNNTRKHEFTY